MQIITCPVCKQIVSKANRRKHVGSPSCVGSAKGRKLVKGDPVRDLKTGVKGLVSVVHDLTGGTTAVVLFPLLPPHTREVFYVEPRKFLELDLATLGVTS
jgi:hypothetical protein